jgi:hypothetical protein
MHISKVILLDCLLSFGVYNSALFIQLNSYLFTIL